MPARPPFQVIPRPDGITVVLRGAVCGPLSRTLHELLVELAPRVDLLVLEFQQVTSLDALGLRALLDANERCASNGGSLRVLDPPHHIRRYLELTEVDQCVAVVRTAEVECELAPARRAIWDLARLRRGRLLDRSTEARWNTISP